VTTSVKLMIKPRDGDGAVKNTHLVLTAFSNLITLIRIKNDGTPSVYGFVAACPVRHGPGT
jgi:hypothetical protein